MYNLNQNHSFRLFNMFYMETNNFKTQFLKELKFYYKYLEFKMISKQEISLKKILTLVCEYQKKIIDLVPDSNFTEEFQIYFKEKKSNINDLDPTKNGNLVLSAIDVEWRIRTRNLDNYFNYVFESNTKKTKPKSMVERAISMFKVKALGYQEPDIEYQLQPYQTPKTIFGN